MDFLALIQAPLGTILVLAGIAIVFFSFFEISKGTVKQKKTLPKNYKVPVAIGSALILGGLFYGIATNVPGEDPPPSEVHIEVASSIDTATSVPTDTATPAPTETAFPTATPIIPTNTATLVPVGTLNDGCIAEQTWQAASIDTNAANNLAFNQDRCWNLNSLGFTAESGGKLHILTVPSNEKTASGIYTAINDRSTIEFKVYVNSFYIVYQDIPGYITFSIAPPDDPMAVSGSGRFKLQVKNRGNSPLVFFMLADTTESNGTELGTQHYLYGRTYNVRMELSGIFMEIYINDIKLNERVVIPSGPKVFYIGYSIPVLASADVEISGIIVDGNNK